MNRRDEEVASIITVIILAAVIAYFAWPTHMASIAPPASCYWDRPMIMYPAVIGNSTPPRYVSEWGYVFNNNCNDNTPVYWAVAPYDCSSFPGFNTNTISIGCYFGNDTAVGPLCATAVGHPNANCPAAAFQMTGTSSMLRSPLDGNVFHPASISVLKSF